MVGKSSIRIIGGKWRSRKISVLGKANLRPTPDRVRETLFNWLSNSTRGASCLDLYAGSGALGFEALSRGAESVFAIESDPELCAELQSTKQKLAAEHYHYKQAKVLDWLSNSSNTAGGRQFDLIFSDPPYASGELSRVLQQIIELKLLATDGFIYFEQPEPQLSAELVNLLQVWRQGRAGRVNYFLVKEQPNA